METANIIFKLVLTSGAVLAGIAILITLFAFLVSIDNHLKEIEKMLRRINENL